MSARASLCRASQTWRDDLSKLIKVGTGCPLSDQFRSRRAGYGQVGDRSGLRWPFHHYDGASSAVGYCLVFDNSAGQV
jgi:hypothetical protein